MSVLLDTCALVALARGDLPARAAAALRAAPEANVSTVSPWEVAIKVANGMTADSYEHAALKAVSIARAKEHSYLNAADQRVSWRFLRINDVREMIDQRLEDGAEVVSWFSGGPDDDGP